MKVIIPGLKNSKEHHWQSIWERENPEDFIRVHQKNWNEPNCEEWILEIEKALQSFEKKHLVLIGHSIGCIAIIHWLIRYRHSVKAVLLVAPADADKPDYPPYISGFSPIPLTTLGVNGIVVASTNDHVTSLERSKLFAEKWGLQLEVIEKAGHIEEKDGFGEWKEGQKFLQLLSHALQ